MTKQLADNSQYISGYQQGQKDQQVIDHICALNAYCKVCEAKECDDIDDYHCNWLECFEIALNEIE